MSMDVPFHFAIDQLPDDMGLLKQLVVGLCETVRQRDQRIQSLEQSLHLLVKRFTRKKSEKFDPRQMQMFLAELGEILEATEMGAPADVPTEEGQKKKRRKNKPHGRGRLPETLTREAVEHDLTPEQKLALGGEEALVRVGEDVTEQLEWRPSALVVIEHHQVKYVLRKPSEKAAATMGAAGEDATEQNSGAVGPATNDNTTGGDSATTNDITANRESAATCDVATIHDATATTEIKPAAARSTPVTLPAKIKSIEEICAELGDRFAAPIIVAEKRNAGLPGCLAAPGLLAEVIVSKYGDHLPLYRLEGIFARQGVNITRKTMCDWCAASAKLLRPLTELIRKRVLQSFVIHTDDTPVEVRDAYAKLKYTGRFWTYLGDEEQRLTWFEFTTTRKRAGPDRVLADFRGYLQADGYGGYDGFDGVEISDESPILKVACWAHARRKFHDALRTEPAAAHVAIARIAQLYKLEKELRAKVATEWRDLAREVRAELIAAERELHAKPVVDAFKVWLDEQLLKALPKSPIATAVRYALNQWDALYRYLEDGRLSIDNNPAERALRGIAIGRKNWLFVGSANGGHTAAVLFTLISSAARNNLNPWTYLEDVLRRMPTLGEHPTVEQLTELLPTKWRPPVAAQKIEKAAA